MNRSLPTVMATTLSLPSATLQRLFLPYRSRVRQPIGFLGVVLFAIALISGSDAAPGVAQGGGGGTSSGLVVVIPIQGVIEPGIGHFLERSLDDADSRGATAVILDINTPGGRLDTVLEMRDAILDSSLRTIAFVNREAFSAGALITIASEEIWIAPGGVFGAATPVLGGETADAKTVSAVRSTFRATAETRGRDPLIAEAMVDPDVVVPDLDSASTLLTLTSDQAMQWQYAEGIASDRSDLLAKLGLASAQINEVSPSPIETIVRWVTDPIVASLLIMLGLFLIVADALFAGFGVAAVAGVLCFALFFWGHLLANLAGWEDLLLIALGLGLIGLEVFVIPGFGVAGIAGTVALAGGLFLTMTGRGFWEFDATGDAVRAGWSVAFGLIGALIALAGFGWLMSRIGGAGSSRGRGIGRLALTTTVAGDSRRDGQASKPPSWLVRRLGGSGVLERGGDPMPDTDQHKKYS
ncbi:MAG: nodulation protein NfeD [Chloroflexota bacterium]|nr:nodulation protein NfeD [Chloroflexota bacterium]